MKKHLLLIASICFVNNLIAQTQIENGGFEGTWEAVTGSELEPAEWNSLKSADALATLAPIVAFQETASPHSGTYCLRLTCTSTFGIVANGIITNGLIHADLNPELGYVFTDVGNAGFELVMNGDKPDSLVGWYKFAPQSGDKAKVEMILHDNTATGQLPETVSTAHWIAKARIEFTTAQANWTRFSTPFYYFNSNAPEYGLIVINAGDSTIAVDGTELIIDDFSLIYNPVLAIEDSKEEIDFSIINSNGILQVNLNKVDNAHIRVFSLDGKEVYNSAILDQNSEHEINAQKGLYIYQIKTGASIFTGKILW